MAKCVQCGFDNPKKAIFCVGCGSVVDSSQFSDKELVQESETKIKGFLESIQDKAKKGAVESKIPQLQHLFDNIAQTKAFLQVFAEYDKQTNKQENVRIDEFISQCDSFLSRDDSFQIAFSGTINAGKSTLINAMLKDEYASTSVTPETAVLTKFRYGQKDEVTISFYNQNEWNEFWSSASKGGVFKEEYDTHKAESHKSKWIGHSPITEELSPDTLRRYTSAKSESHYFAKEVCITLKDFPFEKNIVFVDTPGLDDPVDYRSKVTRDYINRANAVILCVEASALTGNQMQTIQRIFDNTRGRPEKVYILGTKYENLNSPAKDWKAQKQEWAKYLTSSRETDITRFTQAQAESNIIETSGYISFLLDLYEKDKINDESKKQLQQYSFKFFEDIDFTKHIKGLREVSNVDKVFMRIQDDILDKAEREVIEDAKANYKFLHSQIETYFKDSIQGLQESFDASQEGIEAINAKIAKEEKNLAVIENETAELEDVMKKFENQANELVNNLSEEIDKIIKELA
ncbi:dynamin family protein [Helicobacter cinaedi]|uniref:dynamin family protein n=1 Tax=Helicobacter cinaedi TaxID=213 RepID=UPI000CF0BF61|nr:dynamin family protein [Helicobacter cinaedi]